jgi:hypothetical protein
LPANAVRARPYAAGTPISSDSTSVHKPTISELPKDGTTPVEDRKAVSVSSERFVGRNDSGNALSDARLDTAASVMR